MCIYRADGAVGLVKLQWGRGGSSMNRLWRDYGLGWVLLALFLGSWAVQTWTGWREFQSEQRSHQESAQVFGADGYIWRWGEATFENWQSEFLQLLAFVTLTSFLLFRNSPESRDGDDEVKEKLNRIERRLEELHAKTDQDQMSLRNGASLHSSPTSPTT
jgi:hypothetical protein